MKPIEFVEQFLILNGFEKIDTNTFLLNNCIINIEKEYYSLSFGDNDEITEITSENLNIYWLIGYLTYYNIIDRNYKLTN